MRLNIERTRFYQSKKIEFDWQYILQFNRIFRIQQPVGMMQRLVPLSFFFHFFIPISIILHLWKKFASSFSSNINILLLVQFSLSSIQFWIKISWMVLLKIFLKFLDTKKGNFRFRFQLFFFHYRFKIRFCLTKIQSSHWFLNFLWKVFSKTNVSSTLRVFSLEQKSSVSP